MAKSSSSTTRAASTKPVEIKSDTDTATALDTSQPLSDGSEQKPSESDAEEANASIPAPSSASAVFPAEPPVEPDCFTDHKTIHLVDGEKGGVGKTLLARVLVQWFIDHGLEFRAAEADRSNTDLLSIYEEYTSLVMVSENERLSSRTDGLFHMATQSTVIVDLPAQAFRPISEWIGRNDVITIGAANGIGIVKWFVSNGSVTSLNQFEETLHHFKGAIPHVLVRNLYSRDDWSAIDKSEGFQSMIKRYRVPIINLPRLDYDERDLMDEQRLSFGAALEGNQLTVLQKTRVRKFLRAVYAAVESTGLLPQVGQS